MTIEPGADNHRDELPAELDAASYVGAYTFPSLGRRRLAAIVYLVVGVACFGLWATHTGSDHVLVNKGFLAVAIGFALIAGYHLIAAWDLEIDESEALILATRQVGFPVGHASAQLGWRGLRSRPTWRILLYSAENPPERRGLVLVDGIDGAVVGEYVEANPEDWSGLGDLQAAD
jgi:hypothetical protein